MWLNISSLYFRSHEYLLHNGEGLLFEEALIDKIFEKSMISTIIYDVLQYLHHVLRWLLHLWYVTVYDENPSLAVVRKFVHLLDASDNDYAEELGKLILARLWATTATLSASAIAGL